VSKLPVWAEQNPDLFTNDPEFKKLNPGVNTPPSSSPLAPLIAADHSALNQQVWAWIQSDPGARAWLSGTRDENGVLVNPFYKKLSLGKLPAKDSFPRADETVLLTRPPGEYDPGRATLNVLPYINNFDDAAIHVRAANNPEGAAWDPNKPNPDGIPAHIGYWGNGGIEPAGQIFMWAIMDSASLAAYGLVPAKLCDAAGTSCVGPSTSSVTAALAHAKPDRSGILHVDPAAPGSGGYPLVNVTYAAIRTNQDPDALNDFGTLIKYIAGPGQTPGADPGQLPRGYLPLPTNLRTQARSVATRLLAAKSPTLQPSHTTQPPTAQPTLVPPGGIVPPTAAPTTTTTGPPFFTTKATPPPAIRATKTTPMGPVRWALLAVVVAGLGGAAGGPFIRGRRNKSLPDVAP
jgi:hypothetical protein